MLFAETDGRAGDAPVLLLIHGLGANGATWDGVRAAHAYPGRVVVPDLAGHGRSPRAENYSLGRHAADVAALLPSGARVRILGHSMGGAVGILLATGWFGLVVEEIVALGMKLNWTEEERAKMGRPFPVRLFETRDAAAERFLRVAGLAGAVSPEARVVERGIVQDGAHWRLAADPETVTVVGPDIDLAIAAAKAAGARIRLAGGTHDPMVTLDEMRVFDPAAVTIAGAHNVQVDNPAAVAALIA